MDEDRIKFFIELDEAEMGKREHMLTIIGVEGDINTLHINTDELVDLLVTLSVYTSIVGRDDEEQ